MGREVGFISGWGLEKQIKDRRPVDFAFKS
jgi:hypothetical protein